MQLTRATEFSEWIRPVCLPRVQSDPPPGTVCLVAGWGMTVQSDESRRNGRSTDTWSPVLRQVTVNVLDRKTCENSSAYYVGRVSEAVVCAGGPGKDACIVSDEQWLEYMA